MTFVLCCSKSQSGICFRGCCLLSLRVISTVSPQGQPAKSSTSLATPGAIVSVSKFMVGNAL